MSQRARAPVVAAGYPLIPTNEMIHIFDALGINVDPQELAKPHAQTVQSVYQGLLEALMGAPVDLIDNPRSALLGMMEYKELYSDALHFTMFYRHCKQLTMMCGVTSFGMSDLTRPDPARFRSQMSGIMNFAKFREEHLPIKDSYTAKFQRQQEEVIRLRRELERIENSIEDIQMKNAADKPLTEQAKIRNDAIREDLLGLRGEQIKLSHEVEELRALRQTIMEQAASKTHEITNLQSASASAKSRLVQSPDRIKKHISEMTHAVSHERTSLQNHQRKARDLANRLEIIGGMEVDLKGLIDLEKGIEKQKARVEEAKRGVVSLKTKMDNQEIESRSMEAKLGQLQRQIENAQDKHTRLTASTKDTHERGQATFDARRAEYLTQKKEKRSWEKEQKKLQAETKIIEDEMAEFTRSHEEEINELLQEYWTMRKQAEDYMNTVTVKLGLQLKV